MFFVFGLGFFSYILFLEIFMITIIFAKFLFKKYYSSINGIVLLVLGACEVALGLRLLVLKIRVGRLDRLSNKKCGGF